MSSFTNSIISSVASTVVSKISSMYSADHFELLGNEKEILKIGNILNSIFVNRNNIEIPRLVVVGSQSSGKSSILNSILGMDILPTGSNMVTRGPLQMELVQSPGDIRAVFGEYNDGNWYSIREIPITYPNPTSAQTGEIAFTINELTCRYAGDGMNITNKPIYLRIYSPNISNLSLVDLPGLTMIACTDQGQPKDIKDKIKELIGSYINNHSTIILAVMPARTDIEADIGLDLIKEYDPNGERTLGILTKLDLMNEGTDITHLLDNNVSRDLQLGYGYFGIRNRNKLEMDTKNVIEGLKLEQEFFTKHPIYSNKKYKERLGIPSLCKNLSTILVKSLKKNLPIILEKINSDIDTANSQLTILGKPIPKDNNYISAFIHKIISKLTRNYITVLNDRGQTINTGNNIKNHFINFRDELTKIDPFNQDVCSDKYILESINNCEGNHMSFPSPPVEVLEQIMKDPKNKPFFQLKNTCTKTAQLVMKELSELIERLIDTLEIKRFPNFIKFIQNTCINQLILPSLNNTYTQIENELSCQESYIWTDDNIFKNALGTFTGNSIDTMRNLCRVYFNSIIYILKDTIPKKIMYYLVNYSQKEIANRLYEKFNEIDFSTILQEYDDINNQRNSLEKNIKELSNARDMIENIL